MKCSVVEQAKRDWAAVVGPEDDDEGDDDEVDQQQEQRSHHGLHCPVTQDFRDAEAALQRAVTAAGWKVERLLLCNHSAARQIVVQGKGNLAALNAAMTVYLGKIPWVYVEAILNDRPRRRLLVRHAGCPDDPDRVTCELFPLPDWGTYVERTEPGHEISPGVQAMGKYFIASVDGLRIGSYATPEEARDARGLYMARKSGQD